MKRHELPFVREMFDGIAPRYDLLNRLLSLRQDVFWRRSMVAALDLNNGDRVLDTACGTGDVALEIHRQTGGRVLVVATDFSVEMLKLAAPKIQTRQASAQIPLAAADVFDMPFVPETFDAVTMAFGIRNIQDKVEAMACLRRNLKPGGKLAILELATPEVGLLRRTYLHYFNRLLPLVGRLFSRHHYAYRYLPASVAHFPRAHDFAGLMHRAGYRQIRYRKMTLGIAVLFIGTKPQ
jgi:demethylmenaquinone methyltransferase/2-methoxy-6-polyprenyl-1,4-benzoquinol methylase